jgi:hypothetical protein
MNQTRHRGLAIGVLILLVVACVRLAPAARAQSAAATGGAPTKLALLIGINQYLSPEISPLAGSFNDIDDMFQVLTRNFQFLPENIKVLRGPEATHANIIAGIQNLIAKAKAGDIVVVHYSGHGSIVADPNSKKISGLDETLVPFDSRVGKGFDITGRELHLLLVQLAQKTKNVTFILDSCHSGGMVRDIKAARVRSIAPDTRPQPSLPSYAVEGTRGLSNPEQGPPLKFAVIAAATSKESAYEHQVDGKEHGALTYFLAQQLRHAKAGATYRDVMDGVIANVTANYPSQDPQLEGVEADQRVFGDLSSVARPYVLVASAEGRSVKLSVGQVGGATVGSVYDVYEPAAKKFAPPEQPVAKVKLTKVYAFESEGSVLSGGHIVASSRALERSHSYGSSKMLVYLDQVDGSPALQSIRDKLQPLKQIEVTSNPAACHMQLRQKDGQIQMLGADLSILSPSIAADDPAVVTRSLERIKEWAKFFSVLSIRNVRSAIDLEFTLKTPQNRDPMARIGKADVGVSEGEVVVASLQNKSDKGLYIAILDLSSDGSISVVYPTDQGVHEVLTSGSTLTRSFRTSVPPGHTRIRDILKVFASVKPIDLTRLTQPQIRGDIGVGGEPDPIQEFLMGANGATREVNPEPFNLESWTTVQKLLLVKKKAGRT